MARRKPAYGGVNDTELSICGDQLCCFVEEGDERTYRVGREEDEFVGEDGSPYDGCKLESC
jgi:hypothetical protein